MPKIGYVTDEARAALDALIAQLFDVDLDALPPAERYLRIADERAAHANIADRLGELGREVLAEMEAAGMDRAAIGKAVGITRQRVGQILGPRENHRKGY